MENRQYYNQHSVSQQEGGGYVNELTYKQLFAIANQKTR